MNGPFSLSAKSPSSRLILPLCLIQLLLINVSDAADVDTADVMDEIVIIGESQLVKNSMTLDGDALRVANTGDFLKWVPGANLNRNGPLTGLPQYRGSSGDRINIMVDGMAIVAGGPNAMDAPVSSIPGAATKTLSVSRGIASVSSGQETLGGHIAIESQQGQFSDGDSWQSHINANTLYNSAGAGIHASGLAYLTNRQHKLGMSYSFQDGNDQEFSDGEIPNTFFRRDRLAAFYGLRSDATGLEVNYSRTNTKDTGTPALPMDIIFIDSESAHAEVDSQLGGWEWQLKIGTQDVEHGMNNYSHRQPPNMTMGMMTMPMTRFAYAIGEDNHAKLTASNPISNGTLTLGADYSTALHNTLITDPNNSNFFLENFDDVERDIAGVFVEWVQINDAFSWELGLRFNQIEIDADTVGAAGAPPMVAINMMPLAMDFNQSDRNKEYDNVDAIAKLAYSINSSTVLSAGIGRKTRAPSYQELYLWAPLQSTGGLADGRNYIGNLNLDNEQADELNVGLDFDGDSIDISAQLFYRKVDDYVQGTPITNSPLLMQINMLSMMMGGQPALQYNNVDAELYGADVGYHGNFGTQWYFRGNLSYVRGKRDDVSDDLYRIAPLNHSLTIGYRINSFDFNLTSDISAAQNKVATYNNEQATPGYGLIHLNGRWQPSPELQVVIGIDNLFDKNHQLHLNGYNRVANADVLQGERIPGTGRNLRIGFSYLY